MTDGKKPPEIPLGDIESSLAEVIVDYPLYKVFEFSSPVERDLTKIPRTIEKGCSLCGQTQKWDLGPGAEHGKLIYKCRNCKKEFGLYYYIWSGPDQYNHEFQKVGQYPQTEARIPSELRKHLSESDLESYKTALRCRSYSYGLAALAYLRRVVENRMNDLLDLTAELAKSYGFAREDLEQLESVKDGKAFFEKVNYASKILPPNLKPGGTNPMDLLQDLAGKRIHALDEEECIEIFDVSRHVFEYLFRELEVRKSDTGRFLEGVKDFTSRRSNRDSDSS